MSKNSFIYPASLLNIFFRGILDLYVRVEHGQSIDFQILQDFPNKLFSDKLQENKNVKALLEAVVLEDIGVYKALLKSAVSLRIKDTSEVLFEAKELAISWSDFTEEIKYNNRFHFDTVLALEKFKSLFRNYEKSIARDEVFYRARLSKDKKGFSKYSMGSPPSEKATSGRANPEGISYLYLANDVLTALHEVRANQLDYVSVGEFVVLEDLNIINLSDRTYDIFRLSESETLEEVLLHKEFINKLEFELSRPRRSTDSKLDYLPTQYLCELIKSMGYDGIEFRSSLVQIGDNLAIFFPSKLCCRSSKILDVISLSLNYVEV